ncbi:hypothetical protein pb186bvf_011518 [Paramecium bursaria]
MQIGTNSPLLQKLIDLKSNNPPTQKTLDGLNLLLKIFQNLKFDEEKFKLLKYTSITFMNNVISLEGAHEFLLASGFILTDQGYYYRGSNDYNYILFILNQEVGSFEVYQEQDPKVQEIVNKSKAEHQAKLKYKEELIKDFELNKKEVYDRKMGL